jgi:hypothetical protein
MVCYVDLPAGCGSLDAYTAALLALFRRHSAVIQVLLRNIVEFHSAGLWEQLPPGWGDALTALPLEDLVCLASPETPLPEAATADWPPELVEYVTEALRLALPRHRSRQREPAGAAAAAATAAAAAPAAVRPSAACPFIPAEAKLATSGVEIAPAHSAQRQLLRHIKPKKRHELQRLSSVIACVSAGSSAAIPLSIPREPLSLAGQGPPTTVVDIGCGQGYLARILAYVHGLDVVGVEAAQSNTDTATEKASRLRYEVQKKAKNKAQQQLLQQQEGRPEQQPAAPAAELQPRPTERQGTRTADAEASAAPPDEGGDVGAVGDVSFLNRLVCSEQDISAVLAEVASTATTTAAAAISRSAASGDQAATAEAAEEPQAKKQRSGGGKGEHGESRDGSLNGTVTVAGSDDVSSGDGGGGEGEAVCCSCRCSIVGLHACGILTPRILRAYAASPHAESVVAVGCCYHKGGGGSLPLPTGLEEWGADRQSWKGDGAASEGGQVAPTAAAAATAEGGGATAMTTRGRTDAFPMSAAVLSALELEEAGDGGGEGEHTEFGSAAETGGLAVGGWIGSAQSRELACHALEQYTSRPWRHSPLLAKTMDGMPAGAVPGLAALRGSCEAHTGYLKNQCYRAVLELELRATGVAPRVAVGSVKRMERLSFEEYATKALQRLRKAKVLPPSTQQPPPQEPQPLSRDYAPVRWPTHPNNISSLALIGTLGWLTN